MFLLCGVEMHHIIVMPVTYRFYSLFLLYLVVVESRELHFLGRKLHVPLACGRIAYFSFEDLCVKVSVNLRIAVLNFFNLEIRHDVTSSRLRTSGV